MKSDPVTSISQAFPITSVHLSSLSQAASNLNGLWAQLSSGLVSRRIGAWSELIAPRCEMIAFGKASRQEILATPLSSLLLIDAFIRISALKSYCVILCMLLCMTLCMT